MYSPMWLMQYLPSMRWTTVPSLHHSTMLERKYCSCVLIGVSGLCILFGSSFIVDHPRPHQAAGNPLILIIYHSLIKKFNYSILKIKNYLNNISKNHYHVSHREITCRIHRLCHLRWSIVLHAQLQECAYSAAAQHDCCLGPDILSAHGLLLLSWFHL